MVQTTKMKKENSQQQNSMSQFVLLLLLLLLFLLQSGLLVFHFVKTSVASLRGPKMNSVLFIQREKCVRVIEKGRFYEQPLRDTTHSSIYSFCLERLQRYTN